MAMVMPGVPVRRNSREEAMRRIRKYSKVEKAKNSQWKMEDRKLENELRMIERDRKRSDRLLGRERFGLSMELRDMKKDVAEVRNVKNESCVVIGDGSLVRLNSQRIRERRLSLPVNLCTRPSSTSSLLSSDGSISVFNGQPGSRRSSRPGTGILRAGLLPFSTDDVIRNMKQQTENGNDEENDEITEAEDMELRRRLCSTNGRWRRASTSGAMTPDDVKLHFMKRNSMKDIGAFPRVQTPGGPEFDIQTGPRSRLALRRQSMPDIQRARTAILLGTTPNLEPAGEIDDPVNDPRFRSLMGSLTNQFDGLDTKTAKQKKTKVREEAPTAWSGKTETEDGNRMDVNFCKKKLVTTDIVPPYRTSRRMSSAF